MPRIVPQRKARGHRQSEKKVAIWKKTVEFRQFFAVFLENSDPERQMALLMRLAGTW